MPANLNALIRYRTIDRCLSNPYRKWSIADLSEACASALKEHRGIYSGISERTIREDIRVMRSDILGFNAPIVQKEGNYYYEDREYSIFKVSIRESDLLTRVLDFIREIQSEIRHPDVDDIINRISAVLSEQKELPRPAPGDDLPRKVKSARVAESREEDVFMEESALFASEDLKAMESADISWSEILKLID